MVRRLNLIKIVILLLLVSPAISWDWTTHQYAAREICDRLECGQCLDYMLNGSIAPDKDFKDFINHHCYDPLSECPKGGWTCPDVFDCPAIAKSVEWLDKATSDYGCEKFYDIGVASHYYLDSRVFWHRVSNEDESQCHARFESLVGDEISQNFSISVCSINVTKGDFEGYITGFEEQLTQKPDYTWAAIVAIALVVVLAVRFRK